MSLYNKNNIVSQLRARTVKQWQRVIKISNSSKQTRQFFRWDSFRENHLGPRWQGTREKERKRARTAWARAMTKQREAKVTRKRSVYRDIILGASTILLCAAAGWPGFPSKIVIRSRSRRVLTEKLQITDVLGGEKTRSTKKGKGYR